MADQQIYLDPWQCDKLGTSYHNKGLRFVVSAEAVLKSRAEGGYDEEHRQLLEPLGSRTLVTVGVGYGWFQIVEVRT